jgi:hypothetical protein
VQQLLHPITNESEEAMSEEPTPFIEYWNAVDAALLKFFGIDTADAGIDADLIASAQDEGESPEDFAHWYGKKHDLTYLDDWKTMQGMPTPAFVRIVAKDRDTNPSAFRVPFKLFELGQIVSTPGALAACSRDYMGQCLTRHIRGDWGIVCAEDRKANFDALFNGGRLLSAYPIDPAKPCKGFGENTLWIITEADRSATTFLLPKEY